MDYARAALENAPGPVGVAVNGAGLAMDGAEFAYVAGMYAYESAMTSMFGLDHDYVPPPPQPRPKVDGYSRATEVK